VILEAAKIHRFGCRVSMDPSLHSGCRMRALYFSTYRAFLSRPMTR
jgi:hypothetical protein